MSTHQYMHVFPFRSSALKIILGFCVFLISGVSANAQIFESVSLNRDVNINGELRGFDLSSGATIRADYADKQTGEGKGSTISVGMSLELAEAASFGQGIASQSFTANGNEINFLGLADVNVDGYPAYPFQVEGSGTVSAAVRYEFKVAKPTDLILKMNSVVGEFRDEDFSFILSDKAGRIVWASTGVVSDSGGTTRDYEKTLKIATGDYVLQTALSAQSSMSGSASFAGRAWAQFSISAVPEAPGWGMSMMGLGLTYACVRRRQRLRNLH